MSLELFLKVLDACLQILQWCVDEIGSCLVDVMEMYERTVRCLSFGT